MIKSLIVLSFFVVGGISQAAFTKFNLFSLVNDKSQVVCQAFDNGYEEHQNAHPDCTSCMTQHGGCNWICYYPYYTCTAQGQSATGGPGGPITWTVSGSGETETDARMNAISNCFSSGLSFCYVIGCSADNDEVSRQACTQ